MIFKKPGTYSQALSKAIILASFLQFHGTDVSLGKESKKIPSNPVQMFPVLTTTETIIGQPLKLPQKKAKVMVTMIQLEPGARLPIHKHIYQRYGYVISGTFQLIEVDNNKVRTYKKGDFIPEMHGHWHYALNIGKKKLKLLVVDQIEANMQTNTILRD